MSDGPKLRHVGSPLWFIPVACVLAGIALSIATIAVDRAFEFDLLPRWLTGGPDASIGVLTTIAASMVSLTALVLTITMVVVQLAMGQFSPRIVQTFLRDKPSQLAVGLFVATFAHAMLALREVSLTDDGQVPGLAIAVAYVLVLVSIAMLVLYVNHIGRSLRVSSLIELVGDDVRRLIEREYPDHVVEPDTDASVIVLHESGVITGVDHERLVALAAGSGCVVHLAVPVGTFVPSGAPLLRIEGDPSDLDRDAVVATISTAMERTLDEDVAYGLRMLVDVAERSMADSAFLDPTTAVQAIDRLHDALRQLAVRRLPDGQYRDRSGALRLTIPCMTWEMFVHLAFDEIRLAGVRSPQVTRRLVAALNDLVDVAPHQRRAPLLLQRQLLADAVHDVKRANIDREFALEPDLQGIGAQAAAANGDTRQVG